MLDFTTYTLLHKKVSMAEQLIVNWIVILTFSVGAVLEKRINTFLENNVWQSCVQINH